MKELRVTRQLLRLIDEKENEELVVILLDEVFSSLGKAKKKIDKEMLVHAELLERAKDKI